MKRTKKENREILSVVKIAKGYAKQGYKYGEAIEKAQEDVRKQEIEKYESKV